jgi:hypothetical protein
MLQWQARAHLKKRSLLNQARSVTAADKIAKINLLRRTPQITLPSTVLFVRVSDLHLLF